MLLQLLSGYFAAMIEIISKSGGNLLEFTGDAMLAIFPADKRRSDTARAIRAGLRMQRAMAQFATIDTPRGPLGLGMRVGIHSGRFLSANIGTPRRMEYVLLGADVQRTKLAEGAGRVGRVCLTPEARALAQEGFRFEDGEADRLCWCSMTLAPSSWASTISRQPVAARRTRCCSIAASLALSARSRRRWIWSSRWRAIFPSRS